MTLNLLRQALAAATEKVALAMRGRRKRIDNFLRVAIAVGAEFIQSVELFFVLKCLRLAHRGFECRCQFVVDLLGRGWTSEQILREYDHLTQQDIQACLAYASDVLKSERVYLLPA